MEFERLVSRAIFLSLGYLMTIAILAGCSKQDVPVNQNSDGECTREYLNYYNAAIETQFETASRDKATDQKVCTNFLRKYGNVPQTCKATNVATGEVAELKTSDVREVCKSKISPKSFAEVD